MSVKVEIEVDDEVVVAVLKDAIRNASTRAVLMHPEDIIECVRNCDAMNRIIVYFGGIPENYDVNFKPE